MEYKLLVPEASEWSKWSGDPEVMRDEHLGSDYISARAVMNNVNAAFDVGGYRIRTQPSLTEPSTIQPSDTQSSPLQSTSFGFEPSNFDRSDSSSSRHPDFASQAIISASGQWYAVNRSQRCTPFCQTILSHEE